MTIEEKRKALREWCWDEPGDCSGCPLFSLEPINCYTDLPDVLIERNYNVVFGKKEEKPVKVAKTPKTTPTRHHTKIVIKSDGVKFTTAQKYVDGVLVETATARCHPDDKFDLGEGAKVAISQLTQKKRYGRDLKVGEVFENNKLYGGATKYKVVERDGNGVWILPLEGLNAASYLKRYAIEGIVHNSSVLYVLNREEV